MKELFIGYLPFVFAIPFVWSVFMYTLRVNNKFFQPLCSGCCAFLVLLSSFFPTVNIFFSGLIFAALFVSMMVDWILINANTPREYVSVVVGFSIHHIMVIIGLYMFSPVLIDIWGIVTLVVLLIILIPYFIYLWPGIKDVEHEGKWEMVYKIGLIAYAFLWLTHVVKGFSLFTVGKFSLLQGILIGAGGFLFFLGDLKLGANFFKKEASKKSRFWRLLSFWSPTLYQMGQFMLALSCFYFPKG